MRIQEVWGIPILEKKIAFLGEFKNEKRCGHSRGSCHGKIEKNPL